MNTSLKLIREFHLAVDDNNTNIFNWLIYTDKRL